MSNQEAKKPVSLSTMLGIQGGNDFSVAEKKYVVKPMSLTEVDEFMVDNLSLSTQLFAVANEESRKKLEKWLSRHCFDKTGEPMTYEKAKNDDWSIVDLRDFIRKLCDLSG
jgi:hypothetical protein